MNDPPDDDEPSFDPKTWLGPRGRQDSPDGDPPSFDPTTWAPRGRQEPEPPTPRRPGRRALLAAGGLAVAGAAAGGVFLLGRTPAPPSAGKAGSVAPKPAAPQPAAPACRRVRLDVIQGPVDGHDFFASAVARGLADVLVSTFTRALSYDIDFAREVGPSDIFKAVVERELDAGGNAVGPQKLVFAGFEHIPTTQALSEDTGLQADVQKSARLYAWAPEGGEVRWFDYYGRAAQRGLMRTPIEGAHVTSVFGPRTHPIYGYVRTHRGIDFGAPLRTPVFAAADGVVVFARVAGGYGNCLQLRHQPGLETRYGHLFDFNGVKAGDTVRQGQQVAWSGNSGASTGPHLHYEVLVNGEQVDPMSYGGDASGTLRSKLEGAELARFEAELRCIDRVLANQA